MRSRPKWNDRCAGRLFLLCAAVAAWLHTPPTASAVVLDWSTASWTAGSLNNSFNIDASNPGNDVTIGITGDTSKFINFSGVAFPQIDAFSEGGKGAGTKGLDLFMNYDNNTQSIVVTIKFNYSYGVDGVNFQLFDIDVGGFVDQIRSIRGSFQGTNYAPTIVGSANNSVTGTGTNQKITGITGTANTGTGSGDANATISFGNTIDQLTFTYGNDPTASSPPGIQTISLYNINYSPHPHSTPEVSPSLGAMALCGLLISFRAIRQFRASA